ncbi:MAG: hypothetical protein AAF583_03400 [Pseudomonadota bacterium]
MTSAKPPNSILKEEVLKAGLGRLLRMFGAEAVEVELKRQTGPKIGRPAIDDDWQDLEQTLLEDAMIWLKGGDPLAERSNYSLAKAISERQPAVYRQSTHRRVMGKLAEKRLYYILVSAEHLSEQNLPIDDYLRTLSALASGPFLTEIWRTRLDLAQATLNEFKLQYGDPGPTATMEEIQGGVFSGVGSKRNEQFQNVLQILSADLFDL